MVQSRGALELKGKRLLMTVTGDIPAQAAENFVGMSKENEA